jgi:S-(hydroxymethyl)glutathione dehydrogenase / alcohol dehydrogenase
VRLDTVAAVLHAFGEPQSVEPVVLRDPGPGEVLVRMVAAGVCHSDVAQADGEWGFPLPAVLGHEGAGIVEALGPGVEDVEVGRRVVLSLAPGCGGCSHCVAGHPIRCQAALAAMGEGKLTTGPSPIRGRDGPIAAYSLLACFAEHAVVAAASVIPVPDGVPADVAALIGCAVITGFGAATETLAVPAGSRGVVIGVGGVGVNAVQGARVRGAAEIVAVDRSAARLEQAMVFGATETVDTGDEGALAALRRAAPTAGFDWAIVTVGNADAMRLGVDVTRPGGTTAVVGLMPEGSPVPVDLLDLVNYEKTIRGSAYGSQSPRVLVPRIASLYLEGRLLLDELVSRRLPLDGINEAFDLCRRAEGLRTVVAISDGARWR